jgi:peptidoglycan L-alanyl-D-glutamate endopeptidase CwlK
MPNFSTASLKKLADCHSDLQTLFNEAVKTMDMTIVTGYRGQVEQDQAFKDGRSKLMFPHGKHNKLPSMAVDACPYPYDWSKNEPDIKILDAHIKKTAEALGIEITYGGDWTDFPDTDHWELKEKHNG